MTPITKILLIILAAVVVAATGWVIALNVKISAAKTDNFELKAEIARKEIQITKAEASIKEQNEAAEKLKADAITATGRLKDEYERLNIKYRYLKDKTVIIDNSTAPVDCETQLNLIYEAQEAFCYE